MCSGGGGGGSNCASPGDRSTMVSGGVYVSVCGKYWTAILSVPGFGVGVWEVWFAGPGMG